jgi:dihydroorotate dehydrogenase (fumarate)
MNLSTTYLGLALDNPIVPSASPLSHTINGIKQMEDAGAAAVVMYSLFEEQIANDSHTLNHHLSYFTDASAEAASYFPDLDTYNIGPDAYLNLIQRAKQAVNIPIIASLNGITPGGWIEYAQQIEQAGADAIELNIYYIPASIELSGTEIEGRYVDIVRLVRRQIKLPIAVKLSPYFSSIGHQCKQLIEAGADALVLFNRFYQPDFDIEQLETTPNLVLSTRHELRLSLHWIAILYGRLQTDFAITGGVHSHEDVIKGMMAGASVSMMASELLKNGIGRISEVLGHLTHWMEEHEYESIRQMQGSLSQQHVADPTVYERANYMKVLDSWKPDPAGRSLRYGEW